VQRNGRHRGEDDKEWLRDFDGWDLRAYCFVRWHVPEKPIPTDGLTRATIQHVKSQILKRLADKLIETTRPRTDEEIEPEPIPTRPVSDQEILEHLIEHGLRPSSAEELTQAFNRIRLLAQYYHGRTWEDIREHETRTFLVIPLLLALGWAEQQIKIELPVKSRQRADVACFSRPYVGDPKHCVMLIETKGFSQGLDFAREQAHGYAEHFPNCHIILVSNGYCYKAYKRGGHGSFSQNPTAYLNLFRPTDAYPLDPRNVKGCLEVLSMLLP
jgi:hypothetical protein